ncbi:signal transducer and activator of transcription 1 [Magallana gigas]|uniref:signal transducer and activator of transcription 1 n=1 Tax=Magallana gigas TaxID=29159 RepID=UPI00333FFA6E
MEMATSESQSRPDVISYCLANPRFLERWQNIFKLGDQYMRDARLNCQDLFLSKNWESLEQFVLENDENDPKSDEVYKCMYRMILDHFNEMEHEEADQKQRLSQRVVYDNIKNSYEENPKPFITSLCRYLQEEQSLLTQFMMAEAESMEVSPADDQDHILACMDESSKKVKNCIEKLESLEDQLAGFEQFRSGSNGINLSEQQKKLIRFQQRRDQLFTDIKCQLQKIETKAEEAEAILEKKMLAYKEKLKLFYVDLVDHRPPIPTEVERGYSRIGEILYNNLQYVLPKLESLVGSQMVQSTTCSLRSCFERLLKSSFVVTEQQKHIIKVELGSKKRNKEADGNKEEATNQKFRCPKFYATVRLLACDNIDCKGKVKAQFCNESEVNEKFQSGEWESPCEIKLKAKTDESSFEKKALATFKKLEIENFERKQDIQVCEDKFRIVFTTRVRIADQDTLVSTISLPIVVTTGASQSCNVHGSLLWQCFSTNDAFQLPIESASSLKWHIVFDMLNAKMRTLGGRDLCNDEKDHLGSRLMQEENPIPDEMDIPFRRFCVDKMMDIKEGDDKKKSATFWMWFLAVFNLTKFHLQDYWNNELICGFIKKETAEQKLKSNNHNMKDYTYLLRFSDSVITDCQGQNLCGAISATVITNKGKKGKWKFLSTEPFKAETFKVKKKTLAQCVKTTYVKTTDTPAPDGNNVQLLQWLYKSPTSTISTEEAFQTYFTESKNRKENERYKKMEEILVLFNDMDLDDESSPERKREIKKAVGPSKKREAAKTRSGVIKAQRLSEPDPVMHSEATQTDSPMSVPPESPQTYSIGIPQTVLDLNEGQSQGSMGGQPLVSTQDTMETSSLSSVQSISIEEESLSSRHPNLSRMLSSNANTFLTIDEEALGQTLQLLQSEHGFSELLAYPEQQTGNTDFVYSNDQQMSPVPSMDSTQQPSPETSMSSPAYSVQSLQSTDNNQHNGTMESIVYAPASTTTEESIVRKEDEKLAKMKEKMLLFEKLKSKITGKGGSSESYVSSSGSQAFSPQSATTLQSPPHSTCPLAASPAGSIQTNSVQSPNSQSVYSEASSPAGSVASSVVEPILNDPASMNDLIQNLHNVFEEINNASFLNSGSRVPA